MTTLRVTMEFDIDPALAETIDSPGAFEQIINEVLSKDLVAVAPGFGTVGHLRLAAIKSKVRFAPTIQEVSNG